HNHWHILPAKGDGAAVTFTASQEGVNHIVRAAGVFRKTEIAPGAAGEEAAEQGAGEVKTGRLKDGTALIATVEPMHGNMVVVYVANQSGWKRHVLDDTLGRGHAVWLADLNGDGNDEIIVG